MMKATLLAALAAAALGAAINAPAQNWPDRPIRLVVSFPPGGSTDFISRILEGPDKLWVETRKGFNLFDPLTEKFSANSAAALQQMTRKCTGRETIPVFVFPSEDVDEWAERKCRIGHAPRHDYVRTLIQRPCDRFSAKIEIGSNDFGRASQDRSACFAPRQLIGRKQPGEVVTFHYCNYRLWQPLLARHPPNASGSRSGIGGSEVANDPDLLA
jgi:hypothetical protein